MRAISLQGLQQPLSANTASASTVGDAQLVRVTHVSDTGYQTIFVMNSLGTNTTSCTLAAQETIYLQKEPLDKIWASDTSGFVTRVVFVY
jgi:hypothetical protein